MTALPRKLQDLPAAWAHFCLGVERACREEYGLEYGSGPLVCACSGGADSTALLLISLLLCRKNGGSLSCVHLDHGLRAESSQEASQVAELCAALGVPLISRRADVGALSRQRGTGLEETGRAERYALYEEARKGQGTHWVVTAHHLDDLCEDALLRLARGTGWPGLAGMSGRDDDRRILRPLLFTPKETLVDFLRALGMQWIDDPSNTDPAFARNRMRHDVLPRFLRENPNFRENVLRLWRQARLDEEHWKEVIGGIAPEVVDGGLFLSRQVLDGCSPATRQRLYVSLLDRLGPGQALADTVSGLDRAYVSGSCPATIQFPGGKVAKVTTAGILFYMPDPLSHY